MPPCTLCGFEACVAEHLPESTGSKQVIPARLKHLPGRATCRSHQYLPHHLTVDIGEAKITAKVAPSETLVIEAEQVQNGGVEVVKVDLVGDGAEAASVSPCMRPLRTSPQANQAQKLSGWCSRPCFSMGAVRLRSWLHGVRPNSPLQTTSVSSIRPRDFRSRIKPAQGRSLAAQLLGRAPRMSP